MKRIARRATLPAVLTAALTLAACGAPDRTPAIPTGTAPATSAASLTQCSPLATASYPPATLPAPGAMPAGTLMATIAKRKRLVVGVSADTRLLGARDLTSNEFQGFDIAIARQIAKAVFGDETKIQFKAINAAQRAKLLESGDIDLVARAYTMTCDRWKDVAFAGPYFTSFLKVLVRKDERAQSLAELGAQGKRVCATNGSTTLGKLIATKGVKPVAVPLTTDCMVLWQQGQVDGVAADDAILAGLAAQDPSAKIIGDDSVEAEPYGLGISKQHPEFVAFVNGVLEQLRRNGVWTGIYRDSGLAALLPGRSQPKADYSRPLQ